MHEPPMIVEPGPGFTQIANAVLYGGSAVKGKDYSQYPRISQNALTVFLALRSFDHRGEGFVWPGRPLIAEVSRVSLSSVKRALDELKSVQLLTVESGQSSGKPNRYVVRWTFPHDKTKPGAGHSEPGGRFTVTRGAGHSEPLRRSIEEDPYKKTKRGLVSLPSESRAEPSNGSLPLQEENSSDPKQIVFPVDGGKKGQPGEWVLPVKVRSELELAFPKVDHDEVLLKARGWVRLLPSRRKTARGMPQFLFNWFSRAEADRKRDEEQEKKSKNKLAPGERVFLGETWGPWTVPDGR